MRIMAWQTYRPVAPFAGHQDARRKEAGARPAEADAHLDALIARGFPARARTGADAIAIAERRALSGAGWLCRPGDWAHAMRRAPWAALILRI